LAEHVPETIEFTHDNQRFVSAGFSIGVQFEITDKWCEERSIAFKPKFSLPRSMLLGGILNYKGTQGFGFMKGQVRNSEIITWWWNTDQKGDGVVWPNAFGGLILRWQRPIHLKIMYSQIAQPRRM
jgi:hypothetical protein